MSIYICNMFLCLTFSNRIILQCMFFIACFIHVIYIISELSLCQFIWQMVLRWPPMNLVTVSTSLWSSLILGLATWCVDQWDVSKHYSNGGFISTCTWKHIFLQGFLFESRCQVTRRPKQLYGKVNMEKRGSQPITAAELSVELLDQGSAN